MSDSSDPESRRQATVREWRALMRVRAPASAVFDYIAEPEHWGFRLEL